MRLAGEALAHAQKDRASKALFQALNHRTTLQIRFRHGSGGNSGR